jgi:hypothetical protein
MTAPFLDLNKLRAAKSGSQLFPFLVVPEFLRPAAIPLVAADFPAVRPGRRQLGPAGA